MVGCVPSHCKTNSPASFLAYTRSVTIRGSFKASQTVTDCGSTRRSRGPERISGRAVKRSPSGVQDIASISPVSVYYSSTIPSLLADVNVNLLFCSLMLREHLFPCVGYLGYPFQYMCSYDKLYLCLF